MGASQLQTTSALKPTLAVILFLLSAKCKENRGHCCQSRLVIVTEHNVSTGCAVKAARQERGSSSFLSGPLINKGSECFLLHVQHCFTCVQTVIILQYNEYNESQFLK